MALTHVFRVVGVISVEELEYLNLLARLLGKVRVVLDYLDRNVAPLQLVMRMHDLSKRPLQ